jgi:hypothetical protein
VRPPHAHVELEPGLACKTQRFILKLALLICIHKISGGKRSRKIARPEKGRSREIARPEKRSRKIARPHGHRNIMIICIWLSAIRIVQYTIVFVSAHSSCPQNSQGDGYSSFIVHPSCRQRCSVHTTYAEGRPAAASWLS